MVNVIQNQNKHARQGKLALLVHHFLIETDALLCILVLETSGKARIQPNEQLLHGWLGIQKTYLKLQTTAE